MDVLQWIKEDHRQLRALLSKLIATDQTAVRKLCLSELSDSTARHLYLEAEYLYPEISDLYSGASTFVRNGSDAHQAIKKSLNQALASIEKDSADVPEKINKLVDLVEKHLREEEEQLMPKIRELIPTQEREDLGQVFMDLYESGALNDVKKRPSSKRSPAHAL